MDMTVTQEVYGDNSALIYAIKDTVVTGLTDYYQSHIEGNLQIFHSLTVGEILICILLAALLLLLTFKWIWEAIRY
ncbi:hypothetical protein [Paenibacillus thiaminolyticus]|uniref:Uncharacterized protein n=1 Tax=Paenibacillus thiaminolyticus TaxID=49283 RepID=A0A3A3H2Q8_PANTH|nr:hypothetical protein [Paenibacillus thiaminolyticus]RJG23304.1 hypothetical protein DQX05_13730 [Paenibacillus thiaminolyticus]RJG23321.1 hypothetical protein DQX05_13820 [Paenibacillus thiaminolyticus]